MALPRIALWAWERPEDLSTIDTNEVAVAYLDQSILITDQVSVKPRMQRLLVDASAPSVIYPAWCFHGLDNIPRIRA
jgi:hypothetical protein